MIPLSRAPSDGQPAAEQRAPAEPPRPAPRPQRPRERMTARAVVQFGLSGLAALVVLVIGAVLVFQARAEQEAARDARQLTLAIGQGMVGPRISDGVLRGEQEAIDRLDRFMTRRVLELDPSIVRIKLWSPDGRIVYSDEPRLIGDAYPLGEDERRAFASGRSNADISDLRGPENRFERGYGELLEVYLPIETRSGESVLLETYMRYSSVAESAREIWTDFAPALVVALMLMWLVQLPLAWSLARRLQRGRREREALLVQAMEASEAERRRIAGNLHDGVVQDLAGLSLTLAAAAERTDDPDVGPVLTRAARSTRQSIRQMRSLLVDIYPANLHSAGLQAALRDLLAPLAARGLETHARLEDDPVAAPEVEQLVFRTAQEALRNVLHHAHATSVSVDAHVEEGTLHVLVEDDGRGFDPDDGGRARAGGHLGLALLQDRAAAVGGRLAVDSAPGHGTRVRLEVPAA
jgi:two-component system NarL family sensor kinase